MSEMKGFNIQGVDAYDEAWMNEAPNALQASSLSGAEAIF